MSEFKDVYLTRQSTLIPTSVLGQKVTVIGAGGIGCSTVISLARMGISNIEVWDYDKVSEENMNNQGYSISDINIPKVIALAAKVKGAMGFEIDCRFERYDGQQLTGIVIMAVDSMAVRKDIFENNQTAQILIDGRMGAENIDLLVYPNGSEVYARSLFRDDEAPFVPCTEKSTIYCSSLISGLIVKVVKDIITGNPYTKRVLWNLKDNAFQCWLNN